MNDTNKLYAVKKEYNEQFYSMVKRLLEDLESKGLVESQDKGHTSDTIVLPFETIQLLMMVYPDEFKKYRAENPLQ